MTTIQDETRRWFESGGWEEGPAGWIEPTDQGGNYPVELPTIDANYFFDKVVGRMNELHLNFEFTNYGGGIWVAKIPVNESFVYGGEDSIVLAGLTAANNTRKEIGR